MAKVRLNGLTFTYDDTREGADTLLLIHGHPFDRSMWRPQLDAARAAGWRVVVPDLRGYGSSEVLGTKTTLEDFAADLAALLDHLGIATAVVGGLSMGGQIAMQFAESYPERLRGLILAATFAHAESEGGKRVRNETADRLLRDGMFAEAERLLPKMLAQSSIAMLPAVAAHVLEMMCATPPEGAAAALRGRAERPAYAETLRHVAVPALVVVGSEDAFTTREDAERMRDLLQDAELVWMDGAGHMPNLERPADFNTALRRLLARVASVPASVAGTASW